MQNDKIYIEVIPEDFNAGRMTHTTEGKMSTLLKKVALDSNLINTVKQNIDKLCTSFAENFAADELEMEFSYGITANGNICILSGNSSMGIKVKMTWKK